MKQSLKFSVGKVNVAIELELTRGERLEVFLEGKSIIYFGVASSTLHLASGTGLFKRRNSAVIKTERQEILYVAIELCCGQ